MIQKGCYYSKVLGMETALTVILPDFPECKAPHRVVYLLHGLCGSSGDWLNYTMLPVYAAEKGVAIVMPEVARSFYADMERGFKYFTYITGELPQTIANAFNVSDKREDTAIVGGSMGGYGALKAALTMPDRYKYCCSFSSPCLFLRDFLNHMRTPDEIEELKMVLGDRLVNDFLCAFGEGLPLRPQDDLFHLAGNIGNSPRPKLYVACGTEDSMYAENERFASQMLGMGFDTTFEKWSGNHDWYFFGEALRRALRFCFSKD